MTPTTIKPILFQTDATEVLLSLLQKVASCSWLSPEERLEIAILQFLAHRAHFRSARGEPTLPDNQRDRTRAGSLSDPWTLGVRVVNRARQIEEVLPHASCQSIGGARKRSPQRPHELVALVV
jgi:hypothetical protein